MKTTLDLPDDLMRTVKLRAVRENRRLKDVVAELLRKGLAADQNGLLPALHRVQFPLVECAHEAAPEDEVTPERAASLLLEEETRETASR